MDSLVSLVSIHDISPTILSSILTTAYKKANRDSPSSLLLLSDISKDTLRRSTKKSVTLPPVDPSFQSPFTGWNIATVAQFLADNTKGSIVDPNVFLIADEKTTADKTLLLVRRQNNGDGRISLDSVRIAAEWVNTEAVAVSIGQELKELAGLVDQDGVFRG